MQWAHIEVSQGGNSCNIFLNYCENRQIFPNYCKYTQLNCCKLQNVGFLRPPNSLLFPASSPPSPMGMDGRARDGDKEEGVLRTMSNCYSCMSVTGVYYLTGLLPCYIIFQNQPHGFVERTMTHVTL